MTAAYGYALGADAVHAFATLKVRRREQLLRAFERLARYPQLGGDYQEFGASGRTYEVKLVDDMIVTWWVDHAEREVRIVRIERVE